MAKIQETMSLLGAIKIDGVLIYTPRQNSA